ncbi:MAG: hypothetical protein LBJ10_02375 [Clostridiales bacterium]|jgi:hypothetical protein|nr:hypothetical protein [Clostridiales bacterium]
MSGAGKKNPKSAEARGPKLPRAAESPRSQFGEAPRWAFRLCDKEKWSLCALGIPAGLLEKLASLEGQTWAEIMAASGGKSRGTNSHFIGVCDIIPEAQERLRQMRIVEDQLFSLRLTSMGRLWGKLEGGVLHIIWHDARHEICPSGGRGHAK